ncbi:MAG: beta-3-deoxy-D-manno-oct-2-ulosonic acid transferase [Pseudomonadota bacterium]
MSQNRRGAATRLLRPPPFPWAKEPKAKRAPAPDPGSDLDRDAIFAALREARVGGDFWGAEWKRKESQRNPSAPITIGRTDGRHDAADAVAAAEGEEIEFVAPHDGDEAIDPWSALAGADHLIAHGGDEWIALASVLGVRVTVLSAGQFGEPGDSSEDLDQRALAALREPIPDPFGDGWLEPIAAIETLGDWRRTLDGNRGASGERIVAACGMSWWKRDEIRRFLWSPGSPLRIARSDRHALEVAAKEGGSLAVWPSRVSSELAEVASARGVKLVRVEDGFVRSVGLGSNLVPPLSIIVDRAGIHYDPSQPSDLETLLATTQFSHAMLERAERLRAAIVEAGISKYASGEGTGTSAVDKSPQEKRVVLVPGQVEDDMSVLAGGGGLTSNLELLRRVRALEPEADIWWRPHPDVDAGHRKGAVADDEALQHADHIVREGAMSDLLSQADSLHAITSLSGFEALMRGCEVTCHGVPFYSGWGLTRDLGDVPSRRGRRLSLAELIAGVLVLYPRYLDPVTGLPCPPEILIRRLASGDAANRLSWVEPIRRVQGQITRRLRALVAR